MSEQDYPTTSKDECERLIKEVNSDLTEWFDQGKNEGAFLNLINKHLPNFQLIQNSSSQKELDTYCDTYDWIYPFFKTLQEHVESKGSTVLH